MSIPFDRLIWSAQDCAAYLGQSYSQFMRATACTRLAKKLNPLQLAKMMGWKDLKQAMVYYRESADDIAKLL